MKTMKNKIRNRWNYLAKEICTTARKRIEHASEHPPLRLSIVLVLVVATAGVPKTICFEFRTKNTILAWISSNIYKKFTSRGVLEKNICQIWILFFIQLFGTSRASDTLDRFFLRMMYRPWRLRVYTRTAQSAWYTSTRFVMKRLNFMLPIAQKGAARRGISAQFSGGVCENYIVFGFSNDGCGCEWTGGGLNGRGRWLLWPVNNYKIILIVDFEFW